MTCSRWWLHRGQPRRTVSIPATRPGGWQVTVTGLYGRPTGQLSWVEHPGGRIRLLAAGDSEMQLLDDFLAQDLDADGVDVTKDAGISTVRILHPRRIPRLHELPRTARSID